MNICFGLHGKSAAFHSTGISGLNIHPGQVRSGLKEGLLALQPLADLLAALGSDTVDSADPREFVRQDWVFGVRWRRWRPIAVPPEP